MDEVEKWEILYIIWHKLIQVAILKYGFQVCLTKPVPGLPLIGPTWIIKVGWGMLCAEAFQESVSLLLEGAVSGFESGAIAASFPLVGKHGNRAMRTSG